MASPRNMPLVCARTLLYYLPSMVTAYIPGLPDRTAAVVGSGSHTGTSLRPTSGLGIADYGSLDLRDLFGRDSNPLQTCGYENGISSWPITCGNGYACGFNLSPNYAMCCSTNSAGTFISNCQGATTCNGYVGVYTGSTASTGRNIVWCPSASPVCNTFIFYGKNVGDTATYSDYDCTTGTNLIHVAFPTYLTTTTPVTTPVTTPHTTTSPTTTPTTSPPTTPLTTTTSNTDPVSPSSPSIPITPGMASSSSSSGFDGSTTRSSTSVSSSASSDPGSVSASTNVGAVAGGVVGGIGGVALIVGGIVGFLHRKKRMNRKEKVPEISTIG